MTDDLRAQIRRALAEADGFNFDSLEPHDYQQHADKVLAIVQPIADERSRYQSAWRSARRRAAENDEEARRQYASCQRAEQLLHHMTRVASGKIAREPAVMRVEGPAAEAALAQILVRSSEARAENAEAERDRLATELRQHETCRTCGHERHEHAHDSVIRAEYCSRCTVGCDVHDFQLEERR